MNTAYTALCKLLSGRGEPVDWASFTPQDWGAFVRRAEVEGVAPLVYAAWRTGDEKQETENCRPPATFDIPSAAWEQLKASYYRTAAQNTLLFRELERILAEFERMQIPVILLKGAALAQTIYPDPALRPMSDLDLLVHPDDLTSASRAAQLAHYTQEKITYHAYLRGGPDYQVALEIHWCLAQDARGQSPDLDWMWEETEPAADKQRIGNGSADSRQAADSEQRMGNGSADSRQAADSEQRMRNGLAEGGQTTDQQRISGRAHPRALMLNAQAQFLYLTGHLMLQTAPEQRRLIWFYDLYQLYQGPLKTLDWEAFLKSGPGVPWADWVRVALYQLRDLFGVELPPFLTESPPPRPTVQKAETTTSRYIQNAWRKLDGRSRLRMGLALLFPNRAYLVWRYHIRHKYLWPLYLPRRWWEIGHYWVRHR